MAPSRLSHMNLKGLKMDKTTIDKTIELSDWLDANAKIVAQPEDMANGSGKETIYTVPASKEGEFNKVFWKAYCDRTDLSETGVPAKDEVWEVVVGEWETSKGPYKWQKRGYDFDGFYEPGASGKVDCESYRTFREATIYHYRDPLLKREDVHVSVKQYADGTPCMLYVVCFIKQEEQDIKENDETKKEKV